MCLVNNLVLSAKLELVSNGFTVDLVTDKIYLVLTADVTVFVLQATNLHKQNNFNIFLKVFSPISEF